MLIASFLGASTFSDTAVTNGVTYFYVVRAVDTSNNESADSEEASATPQPPSGPTNLVAVPGNAVVNLDWDDITDSGLAGYNVYRSTTGGQS